MPNVNATYGEKQAAAAATAETGNQAESGDSGSGGHHRRAVVCSIRHRHRLNGTSGRSPHAGYDRGQRVICPLSSRDRGRPWLREGHQSPQVVATYKAKKYEASGYRTVTATIDAIDFPDLRDNTSNNPEWNGSAYHDLAVLLSVLIQEQILTWDPADIRTDEIRIRRPADRAKP